MAGMPLASYILLTVLATAYGDWFEHDGYSYHIGAVGTENWFEAEKYCNQNSGHLASIRNDGEREFVTSMLGDADGNNGNAYFWVGLTKYMRKQWEWVQTGDFATDSFPADDEDIHLSEKHFCGSLNKDGDYKKDHCDRPLPFICSRKVGDHGTVAPPTQKPLRESACPHGWKGTDGTENKCFKVFDGPEHKVTQAEALERCRGLQDGLYADLASIRTLQESALITAIIPENTQGLFIGLYRNQGNGDFYWTDNSPYDFNYFCRHEGKVQHCREPSNGWNELCVEVWYHPVPGTWNDMPCTDKRGYICEVYKNPDEHIATEAPSKKCEEYGEGWKHYGQGCYKYLESEGNWETQRAKCESLSQKGHSATMVTIHSEPENSALLVAVNGRGKSIWLGLHDVDGEMKWVDGWDAYFYKWDKDQPDPKTGNHTCGAYNNYNGKWYLEDCNRSDLHTICKITDEPPVTKPPLVEGSCPDEVYSHVSEWKKFGSFCYLADKSYKNWREALAECTSYNNGNLVSIMNKQENVFVHDLIYEKFSHHIQGAWTGLHHRRRHDENYRFAWTDGNDIAYEHWAPGEPNNNAGSGDYNAEECVEMYIDLPRPSMWNDEKCSKAKPFVCKAPQEKLITAPEDIGTCPEGWDAYGAKCYQYQVELPMDYPVTLDFCKRLDSKSHPAIIDSKYYQKHVFSQLHDHEDMITGAKEYYNFFIGLNKVVDKFGKVGWEWHNGDLLKPGDYQNWASGEPNTKNNDGNCVYMEHSTQDEGRWKVVSCEAKHLFACERPKDPHGMSAGAIAGTVIGVLLALILVTGGVLFALDKFGFVDVRQQFEDTKAKLGFNNENYNNFDNEAGGSS